MSRTILAAVLFLAAWLVCSAARGADAPVQPIAIDYPGEQVRADVSRYEESAKRVSFAIDSEGPVRVRLSPRTFPIEAGAEYSVNTSYYDPWLMRAETAGRLALDLDTPRNCTVVVERSRGGNLLPDPSFEKSLPGVKAEGWEFGVESNQVPAVGSVDALLPSAVPGGGADGSLTAVTGSSGRSGRQCLVMVRDGGDKAPTMRSAAGVPAQPGTDYLFSGYYRLEEARFGCSLSFTASVVCPGKETLAFAADWINPLILESPGGGWRRAFTTIRVPADYGNAEIRLSITATGLPFRVYWDDMELRVAPSKAIEYPGTLSAEKIKPRYDAAEVNRIMSARKPAVIQKPVIGKTPLKVNGKTVPLFAFTSHPDPIDWPKQSAHADFLSAGLKLHFLPALTVTDKFPSHSLWLDEGKYDFSSLEKELTTLLGYDPDALALFYLYIQPYPTFGDKHPESRWINAAGQTTIGEKESWRPATEREGSESWNISYTAPAYRRETCDFLRAMGRFLAKSNVGKQVIGVNLAGGTDGQWFVHGWGRDFGDFDYSPGNAAAFRDWLKRRYGGSVPAFRKAWGNPKLTFESATIPQEKERAVEYYLLKHDSGSDRRLMDANLFHYEGVAETINLFARAFEEGLGRESIAFTYYPKKHLALRTLLDKPDLDGVVGVMEYGTWRLPGRGGGNESSPASLRLHNKLFLTEMDYRTEYSDSWGRDTNEMREDWGATKGPEQAANQLRRDLGNSLCQFQGGWIYGLPGNGWITDAHMANMAEGARAALLAMENPMPEDRGQAAVFMDERVHAYGSYRNYWSLARHYIGNYHPRQSLNRSGVSWDDYVLTDLDDAKRPGYKLNLFLISNTITPRQIDWVRKNLQKNGNVLVFLDGAACDSGVNFEENARKLTGMTIKVDEAASGARHLVPVGGDSLVEGVRDIVAQWGGPMYYVDDPSAVPLAILSGTDRVGAAVKRFPNWTSVYISPLGGITPRLFRLLAGEAGLTPVGPEEDVTYAGNGFLVIHALKSGEKTLHWTGKSDLTDLTTGRTVAKDADSVTFPMKALETRWFRRSAAPR